MDKQEKDGAKKGRDLFQTNFGGLRWSEVVVACSFELGRGRIAKSLEKAGKSCSVDELPCLTAFAFRFSFCWGKGKKTKTVDPRRQ